MAKKSQKREARKIRELMEGFTEGTLSASDLIDAANSGGVLSALAEELLEELTDRHNCWVNHPTMGVRRPVVEQNGSATLTFVDETNGATEGSQLEDVQDVVDAEIADNMTDEVMSGPFNLGPAGSTGPEKDSDDDLADAEVVDPDAVIRLVEINVHPSVTLFFGGPSVASLLQLADMFGGLPRG